MYGGALITNWENQSSMVLNPFSVFPVLIVPSLCLSILFWLLPLHPLLLIPPPPHPTSARADCSNPFPWRLVTFWQQPSLPGIIINSTPKNHRVVHIHHLLILPASAHFGPDRLGGPGVESCFLMRRPQSC